MLFFFIVSQLLSYLPIQCFLSSHSQNSLFFHFFPFFSFSFLSQFLGFLLHRVSCHPTLKLIFFHYFLSRFPFFSHCLVFFIPNSLIRSFCSTLPFHLASKLSHAHFSLHFFPPFSPVGIFFTLHPPLKLFFISFVLFHVSLVFLYYLFSFSS